MPDAAVCCLRGFVVDMRSGLGQIGRSFEIGEHNIIPGFAISSELCMLLSRGSPCWGPSIVGEGVWVCKILGSLCSIQDTSDVSSLLK